MKESFANLADVIGSTQSLAEMELQSYLASLSSAQQTQFVATNVSDAVNAVSAAKEKQFLNAQTALKGADTNITTAAYYVARTADLNNLASDVNNIVAPQATAVKSNRDSAGRQYEINEWSNSDKLDTLFFLQVLFIALTFTGALLFLMRNGLLPSSLFGLFVFIAALIAVLVLIIRARFTTVVRDGRYWNKFRYPETGVSLPVVKLA